MEDTRLLSLLDKFVTVDDVAFEATCLELVGLIKKYLSKSKKIGMDEKEVKELRNYLAKRILDGSTSDEPKLQDRYLTTLRIVLQDSELLPFFDNSEILAAINSACSVANAIKKSEKKYFAYSHVACLMDFYFASQITKLAAVKTQLDSFMQDIKEAGYFLSGYLAALEVSRPDKAFQDKAKALIEDLASHKVILESYKQATFFLVLQNLAKSLKTKIDNARYETLETNCGAVSSTKNITRYFEEIIVDDSLNTSLSVPYFTALCSNLLERDSEKGLGKLFKFFQHTLETLEKDKNLRQKRAFHLVGFFKAFVSRVDPQILLGMDIDQSIQKKLAQQLGNSSGPRAEGESIADIFTSLIDFWLKQIGNKNPESRQISVELDHALAEKVRQSDKDTAAKLTLFLLKVTKYTPTNSLRGGDLKLMPTLLGLLYQDDKLFSQYFGVLKGKLGTSRRVTELNFFLNELEHLGQVALTAKLHKGLDSEKETSHRLAVMKYLVDFFMHCDSESTLGSHLSAQKIEWNEQELSFRKFRTKVFERICNLVFKREDQVLLAKAAELYSKAASGHNTDLAAYFKMVADAGQMLSKSGTRSAELTALFRALTFMNVFEDDIEKNFDLVADLAKTSLQMGGSAKQSPIKKVKQSASGPADIPEGLFVDAMVGLCSTTQPQMKPLISSAFESCCCKVGPVGFSFLLQAIVKPDSQYLNDGGEEENPEDMDEETPEGDEEGLAGQDIEEDQESAEEEVDDDAGLLGKRALRHNKDARPDKTNRKKGVPQEAANHTLRNGKSKAGKSEHNDIGTKDQKAKA